MSLTVFSIDGNLPILSNERNRKNHQRIHEFTGFPFQIKTEEYDGKIPLIKNDFSVNNLIDFCNAFHVNNSGSFDNLTARKTSCLGDLILPKVNVVHNTNSDIEPEILNTAINNKSSDIVKNSNRNNTSVHNISEDNTVSISKV